MTATHRLWNLAAREGAVAVFVALTMVVLLGVAALAVDIGYLYVVRGELQNAADAGALAGAQALYSPTGRQVNVGANALAIDYVTRNFSENAAVTVDRVERGHWSFTGRTFTPNDTLAPADLFDQTTSQLDANAAFVNAIRVTTTRRTVGGQVAAPFFASALGITGSAMTATSVAYIGFAGSARPNEFGEPLAICRQAIAGTGGDGFACNGAMMTGGPSAAETGGYTDFDTGCAVPNPWDGTCAPNTNYVRRNDRIATVGPSIFAAYGAAGDHCWWLNRTLDTTHIDGTPGVDGIPDRPWTMTLPVVECPGGRVASCSRVVGAAGIKVLWIVDEDVSYSQVPRLMHYDQTGPAYWACSVPASVRNLSFAQGLQCWNEFRDAFRLRNGGAAAPYQTNTLYYQADCSPHPQIGTTGGDNFGVLAKIPVLVQ
jgi:Flp pilus assembly protein TadG